MKRVILESPYAGTSRWAPLRWWQRRRNIRYARACVRDSVLRGEAPIASHLLFTQPGILNDDVPEERALCIEAGLEWRHVAEETVVYHDRGISRGMRYGIELAQMADIPIRYRTLKHPASEAVDPYGVMPTP